MICWNKLHLNCITMSKSNHHPRHCIKPRVCVRKPNLRYSHSFVSPTPCCQRRKWPTPEDDRNPTLTLRFIYFFKMKIFEKRTRKDYNITCYTRRDSLQSRAPFEGPQLASGPLITFWPPFWDIVFRLISSLPPLLACCCINALGIFCWGPFEGPFFLYLGVGSLVWSHILCNVSTQPCETGKLVLTVVSEECLFIINFFSFNIRGQLNFQSGIKGLWHAFVFKRD